MSPTELRSLKETAKANIKEDFNLPKSLPFVALVALKDEAARDFILEGLSAIGIGNVVFWIEETNDRRYAGARKAINHNELLAFDFIIYDGEHDGIDIVKFMKAGVVPIMPERNIFAGILREFNPMKFDGNGFFFKSNNPYCIFEKIITYLENIKFPEDRRILLKHVMETF